MKQKIAAVILAGIAVFLLTSGEAQACSSRNRTGFDRNRPVYNGNVSMFRGTHARVVYTRNNGNARITRRNNITMVRSRNNRNSNVFRGRRSSNNNSVVIYGNNRWN